jgi:hypothetical protein
LSILYVFRAGLSLNSMAVNMPTQPTTMNDATHGYISKDFGYCACGTTNGYHSVKQSWNRYGKRCRLNSRFDTPEIVMHPSPPTPPPRGGRGEKPIPTGSRVRYFSPPPSRGRGWGRGFSKQYF